MYRSEIWVSERTDVEAQVQVMRSESALSGLAPQVVDELTEKVHAILVTLVRQRDNLGSQGTQMSASRRLVGDGYDVQIMFGTSRKSSWLGQIVNGLRGR